MERKVEQVRFRNLAVPKQKRVAAYARVSIDKDAMRHSLAAQVSRYSDMIQNHAGWQYAGVYADYAQSGTKNNRDEFNRLLADCSDGKIDMIITKSISRFARNTVTLLEAIRDLKEMGVDVYFEEQNIHTLSSDGELMLTLLASFAQEESLSFSDNVKWCVHKHFEEGKPWNCRVYGYRAVNGVFYIHPEEAAVVRRIYQFYLDGWGANRIVKQLISESVPTRQNGEWTEGTIRRILTNPTYIGTLVLQTTYNDNHITKKKKYNHGELPMYIVKDAHEPIINQQTFDAVAVEMEARSKRAAHKNQNNDSPFAKKIECCNCGRHYRRRRSNSKTKWVCTTFAQRGKTMCPCSREIPETELKRLSAEVLGLDGFDDNTFKATPHNSHRR